MAGLEVRMRLIEALIPAASRHGITDPSSIVESARVMEKYVLADSSCKDEDPVVSSASNDGGPPDPSNKKTLSLPRKDKSGKGLPDFLTPPVVDKSDQAHR